MGGPGTEHRYLTYDEAAEYCRLNRTTLWRAVKAGGLKLYGPGTAVRFRREELDLFMDARNRQR
jgi:excisionase family DNA binding protein